MTMRTLARILINAVLFAATLGAINWLMSQPVYQKASHDSRVAFVAGIFAGFFILACILLRLVPSKAQVAKRQQAARASRSPFSVIR